MFSGGRSMLLRSTSLAQQWHYYQNGYVNDCPAGVRVHAGRREDGDGRRSSGDLQPRRASRVNPHSGTTRSRINHAPGRSAAQRRTNILNRKVYGVKARFVPNASTAGKVLVITTKRGSLQRWHISRADIKQHRARTGGQLASKLSCHQVG
jgi:hypothetical protein